MKLAHLSDVHLGFRQYHRLNRQGVNQREADVAAAFRNAIEGVIEARPDLVVIAGDLFHSVRPSNPAILHSFTQFRRLRLGLPDVPIVIVAGNHDTPRSVETGTILRLFEAVEGVHVVADQPRDLIFDELDVSVTCVPHAAWSQTPRPSLVPRGGSKYQVVVTHGEVAGVLPPDSWTHEYGGALLEPAELHADRWDYVALGHFHVAHKVRDNAWYSGALEYVSPNPWGELKDEAREGRPGQKGWLLVQLGDDGPTVRFQSLPLARRLFDLQPIQGAGCSPEEIDAEIANRIAALPVDVTDQIIRQVVYDVPRSVARELDHAYVRDLKARALHFHLDVRRPPPARDAELVAPAARMTLREILVGYLERRPLDATLDRTRLIDLATTYMDQADKGEPEGAA